VNDDSERDAETPAEARLVGYLDDLREDPPTPGTALVPSVLRSVRWQRAVRPYLTSVGRIFSSMAEGVRTIAARNRSR
jgi:hypothetical protein